MLDTDILSAFLRGNMAVINSVDEHLKEYGFVSLSVITYYEIMNGLLYKDAKKQLTRFEEFVSLNKVIPLSVRMAKTASVIQADLRSKGSEIGHTDTLIAATAIVSELQLVTNNTDRFKRIKGLQFTNWIYITTQAKSSSSSADSALAPLADKLHYIEVYIVNQDSCTDRMQSDNFTVDSSMMCADGNGKDACHGVCVILI